MWEKHADTNALKSSAFKHIDDKFSPGHYFEISFK